MPRGTKRRKQLDAFAARARSRDNLDDAVTQFASAYADQNEHDFPQLHRRHPIRTPRGDSCLVADESITTWRVHREVTAV
jgi:hypothetical protein